MRTETRRDEFLVYYKMDGDDTEYCTTPLVWEIKQLRAKILSFGVDEGLMKEYDAATLANFFAEES